MTTTPQAANKHLMYLFAICFSYALSAQSPLDVSEFQTNADVIIECVAAEPLVIDPVAMSFDEDQRLWVAENRGYPISSEGVQEGSIALLQDLDRDGYFEHRTTFAEHLNYPNGILPWEDGIIVTDAPDVLYMKDTDGDGVCDLRQVLLTGFDISRSTQLRVNDPTLGPDGWIYLAGGLSAGRVKAPWQSEAHTVDMRRHDLRFHPYDWRLKPTTGKSQFGLDFDRHGNRFICMNRIQVQQVVTEDTSWGANPHFHFSKTVENLPEERLDDLLKGYNAGARIYPLTQHLTTADSHAGTFTAACAVTIYESHGLPERYFGHVFSCDPTGNLIHFDRLIPKGPTYIARRENTRTEFVASNDHWFRPVFLATGPDGSLYVCDMRRKTIEHPDYLPQEVRKRTDFASGKDMGRIYRIRAAKNVERAINAPPTNPSRPFVNLRMSESSFRAAVDASRREGLKKIPSHPESPPVSAFETSIFSGFYERLDFHNISEVPSDRTPFQIAMISRFWEHPLRSVVLARLLVQHGDSEWVRAACLNASSGYNREILREVYCYPNIDRYLSKSQKEKIAIFNKTGHLESVQTLAKMAILEGSEPSELFSDLLERKLSTDIKRLFNANDPTLNQFYDAHEQPANNALLFAALLLGVESSGKLPKANPNHPWFGWAPSESPEAWQQVRQGLIDYSPDNPSTEESSLLTRFRILAGIDTWVWKLHQAVDLHDVKLLDLVIDAIDSTQGTEILNEVLDPTVWNRLPHHARNRFIQAACAHRPHADRLLKGIEDSVIHPGMLNAHLRKQWSRLLNDDQQHRLEDLIGKQASPDAAASYARYKPATQVDGNPEIGKILFNTMCSSCHRLDQEGYALGPDLFGIRNQAKESILLHIVDPNHEIAAGFEGVEWTTENDEVYVGLLGFESMEQLTLKLPNGLERTFQRNEGGSLRNLPFSFMPEGIIDALSVQQVADLLAYLRGE